MSSEAPRRGGVYCGLMSGTSLDGISAAVARFTPSIGERYDVELLGFHVHPYTSAQRERMLAAMREGSAREYCRLAADFGGWLADAAVAEVHDLPPEARALLSAAAEVYVVTPTLPGRLAWLADDVDQFRHLADERLDTVLGQIDAVRPTLVVVVTTITIATLKIFDIPRTMTGARFDTQVLANMMYDQSFTFGNAGTGSALAVVIFILVIPIVVFNVRQMIKNREVRGA